MNLWIRNLFTFFREGNPRQISPVLRDWEGMVRMHFLYSAIESGLLNMLEEPCSKEILIKELQIQRPEILEALLDLGLSCGEISSKDGMYFMNGKRMRALAGENGDALAALIQGNVTYYNSLYKEAAGRLRGEEKGDYLGQIGDIVARYSKIVEPYLSNLVVEVLKGRRYPRYLDIGCGTGVYLKTACSATPQLNGTGLEMDPKVVEIARQNLKDWSISDNVIIIEGDIRTPPSELQGPFDLITFFNAVYYFNDSERLDLFKNLRKLLSTEGELVIASSFRSKDMDIGSANLNLATSSMSGCTPLPTTQEILSQLEQCGYNRIKVEKLLPGSSMYVVSAN
jgi:2-polyprenyl-3-methyl-5-hydroxy-6-metoxy-1,4-benzoquinol methylase